MEPQSTDSVDKLIDTVFEKKLEHVVSFLMESHLPAFGLLHAVFMFFEPFVVPFISSNSMAGFKTLMTDAELREYALAKMHERIIK